ncbi:MAG: hypothetical protein Fur003_3060 [Candidatus Dojkabacteria bacterium]
MFKQLLQKLGISKPPIEEPSVNPVISEKILTQKIDPSSFSLLKKQEDLKKLDAYQKELAVKNAENLSKAQESNEVLAEEQVRIYQALKLRNPFRGE